MSQHVCTCLKKPQKNARGEKVYDLEGVVKGLVMVLEQVSI